MSTSPTTSRRPAHREPGLVMFALVVLYSALVWAWWPAERLVGGVSMVVVLMAVGGVLWVVLTVVFVRWVERLEREGEQV
ncbi:hypothetical protein [Serinicoccus marinus]|uniref:hypothetical protein n=1 Tax=Serinicoccus marinus TaxID=247333 RepID=UPI0003B5A4CD|nr:hypothetical protein [Serinicoccus marinus]